MGNQEMGKKNQVSMKVPVTFRNYLYEVKAEQPDKSLIRIMDDMARKNTKKRRKHEIHWPKI